VLELSVAACSVSSPVPFRSATWTAAMSVVLDRDGGDLARTRRVGLERFEAAVRRESSDAVGRACLRIVRLLFAALSHRAGVIIHRPCALSPRDVGPRSTSRRTLGGATSRHRFTAGGLAGFRAG
jgi:hypothetical protein